MNIYFTAPIRGIKDIDPYLREIHETITKLGHTHVDDYINRINKGQDFYEKLNDGGQKAYGRYYSKTLDSILKADINIFDCSIASLGIGFQIEKSLAYNKPTIVLYFKNHAPHFFIGITNEKFFVREYNERNVRSVVKDAIENAQHVNEKRFNFFISPSLLAYLEEESNIQGVTKSAYVRHLIIEDWKRKRK